MRISIAILVCVSTLGGVSLFSQSAYAQSSQGFSLGTVRMRFGEDPLIADPVSFDPKTGQPLFRLSRQTEDGFELHTVAVSPDGKLLVTTGLDCIGRLWEVATGREIRTFSRLSSATFSADGKILVLGCGSEAILCALESGRQIRTFHHSNAVTSAAVSADGHWLVTGCSYDETTHVYDETTHVFDLGTGKEVRVFKKVAVPLPGNGLTPDGKWLATSLEKVRPIWDESDRLVDIWDASTGKKLHALAHPKCPSCMAMFADGKFVLTGSWDGIARLWDVSTGKLVRLFAPDRERGRLNSVAVSRDGKWLATANSDHTASVWELATGKVVGVFGHPGIVYSVALSPDGCQLFTGVRYSQVADGNCASLWDVATGKRIRGFYALTEKGASVVVSEDAKKLTIATKNGSMRMWDLTTGKQTQRLTANADSILHMVQSADSRYLATGSDDGSSCLWELATARKLCCCNAGRGWVSSLALSTGAKWFVTGNEDGSGCLWDAATGKQVREFQGHIGPIFSVVLSRDEKWLVTGATSPDDDSKREDNTARLWEVATGRQVRVFTGHSRAVSSVALSNDCKSLITASWDGTAKLWEVDSGRQVRVFQGHTEPIYCVALSNQDRFLFTGSDDGTVKLWEVATGKPIREFKGNGAAVNSISISSDDKHLFAATDQFTIVWEVSSGKELCRLYSSRGGPGWAVIDPEGRFDMGDDFEGVYWVAGTETVSLGLLKDRFYDPG